MVRTFEPTNIHAAKLVDLPLVRRLTEDGVVLDSELIYTREAMDSSSLILSRLLPQRGIYTLVGRHGREKVVGQFRLRSDHPLAHMVFVAPTPHIDESDTAWLHLLDAVAIEAGKRGAYMLVAEVDEDSALFETLRLANFSVYARQEIWRWSGDIEKLSAWEPVQLDELTTAEEGEIHSLYTSVVPTLLQPVAAPSEEATGWLYRRRGRLRAHIAYSEGRYGGYLMPYVHHDVVGSEAESLFAAALIQAKASRQPVSVCLRRYQEWLETSLDALGFEMAREQAVMVRHIAAGVRHAVFAQSSSALESIPHIVRPPTSSSAKYLRSGEMLNSIWKDA